MKNIIEHDMFHEGSTTTGMLDGTALQNDEDSSTIRLLTTLNYSGNHSYRMILLSFFMAAKSKIVFSRAT
jgi:hypothetical protein